jgi:hypothetical protein
LRIVVLGNERANPSGWWTKRFRIRIGSSLLTVQIGQVAAADVSLDRVAAVPALTRDRQAASVGKAVVGLLAAV